MNQLQTVKGPYSRIQFVDINLNSDTQVKKYLLSVGWKPTAWNYKKKDGRWVYGDDRKKIKTSPKLTEDSFASVKGDIPKLVARRSILAHRKSLLGPLNAKGKPGGLLSYIRSDGRIAAQGIPQATNTGRYRHRQVVNIPAVRAVYGKELRSLFIASPGYNLVGIDADGLEARMQAHYIFPYTGGEDYAHQLIDGDVHSDNTVLFELAPSLDKVTKETRDASKSPYYAIVYGCTPPTFADTLGCDVPKATRIIDTWWEANPALREFRDDCVKEYKANGFIVGLDGRKIRCRSEHSLVNAKFQSAGSIVVKTATCFLFNKWVPKHKLDAKLEIHMHDEFNSEVSIADTDRYCMLAERSFTQAGKFYNLNVPITGSCKIGRSWYDVH